MELRPRPPAPLPQQLACAVQRSIRLLLFVLLGLCLGCGGARHAPKYTWLRKQGPVPATSRPALPPPEEPVHSGPTGPDGEADPATAFAQAERSALPAITHRSTPAEADTGWQLPLAAQHAMPDRGQAQDPLLSTPEAGPWNAKAIAALPLGLATVLVGVASQSIYLLLVGGAIAFALGLIGSRQCRDRGDRGKGLALAGMALGAAALFFSAMVLIWAAS